MHLCCCLQTDTCNNLNKTFTSWSNFIIWSRGRAVSNKGRNFHFFPKLPLFPFLVLLTKTTPHPCMLCTGLHAFSFVCVNREAVNCLNASGNCDLPVVMFKCLVLKQGSVHLIQVHAGSFLWLMHAILSGGG